MEEIVILAGVAVLIVLVAAICVFFRMLYVQERNHRILQEVLMHLRELRAAGKAAAAPPMPDRMKMKRCVNRRMILPGPTPFRCRLRCRRRRSR